MNAPPNERPDHDEALIRALIAPGDGSIVDALMALPQLRADAGASPVLGDALQAALARKLKARLEREAQDRDRRDAA
jgi:hypothetical protein